MPQSLVSRVNLDFLYPPFLAVALEVLAACERRGARYVATRGFSTYAEQTALWRRGRFGEPGPVVTAAMGGQSSHNFGLAFDVVRDATPDTPKVDPGWRPADYALLGEECEAHGLLWGGTFKAFDGPHFQWPGWATGTALRPLRLELDFATGRGLSTRRALERAWRLLDAERATPEWQAANPNLAAALEVLDFRPTDRSRTA